MAINIKQIIKEELVHHKLDEHINRAKESVNEAKFNFSEPAVRRAAALLAKAMEKVDGVKIKVHDFEWFADEQGRKGGASFALSWDGDKHDGGSYGISDKGEVINHAYPGNPVYGNIKSSARDFEKGIRKHTARTDESINEGQGKLSDKDLEIIRQLIKDPNAKLTSTERKILKKVIGESVNEAVKPIKVSGNLKKDLANVTHMATKMVKYAKDNFNTYIPTGHMLSQLTVAGYKEKDVLKYNIAHLAKAINTDLKKKYMKDFMAETVNEMQVINKKTGKDVTKHMIAYMEGKISKKQFEELTGLTKGALGKGFQGVKLKESSAEYAKSLATIAKDRQLKMLSKKDKETLLKIADLMKRANEGTIDVSEEQMAVLKEKLVFYVDKKGKKRRFDTDAAANKKYRKS